MDDLPQTASCSSADTLAEAARAAGKSEVLDQLAKDYPKGPHDQPQSMCPAFGSLRVGLRMRRVATILSGSACCVYGLTFTSHFYGARRSVGYVPFNSETLVTGKLYEDIIEAVHLTGRVEFIDDEPTMERISDTLDVKYAAYRGDRGAMPEKTQAHYAGRTFLRLVPDERIISWNNQRIPMKGGS